MLLRAFASFVICALIPAAAYAAELDPSAKSLVEFAINDSGLNSAEGRAKMIAQVERYCAAVDRSFPRNSPAEEAWLIGEVRGGGERGMRAAGSSEWGRRHAALFVDQCKESVRQINGAPETARGYIALAQAFLRFSGSSDIHAKRNSVDPEVLGLPSLPWLTTEALLTAAQFVAQ